MLSASASVTLGGNDGAEAGPSFPGSLDPDRIDEGTEGDVADSETSDRLPRRAVFAARAESNPPRAPPSAGLPSPALGIFTVLELTEADPGSEAVAEEAGESAFEPAAPLPRPTLPRVSRAELRDEDDAEAPDGTDAESEAFDPVEPAEPVVSAKATGTEPVAEPTPNATANAPTRPTYRK